MNQIDNTNTEYPRLITSKYTRLLAYTLHSKLKGNVYNSINSALMSDLRQPDNSLCTCIDLFKGMPMVTL